MGGVKPCVFGFRLRYAMNRRKIRRRDFAAAVQRSENTVEKWRGGHQMPAAETLAKIADVLHVSVDFLLGKTENMEPAAPVKSQNLLVMGERV